MEEAEKTLIVGYEELPQRGRLWFKLWEVRALTDLSDRQVGYAVRTGMVTPYKQGAERLYSWYNLFELYCIAKLRASGESLQSIRGYFSTLREWLQQFSPDTLKANTLVMRVSPTGLADAFLAQSEGFVKALRPWATAFVVVRFSALTAAISWVDNRPGLTIKDVVVA